MVTTQAFCFLLGPLHHLIFLIYPPSTNDNVSFPLLISSSISLVFILGSVPLPFYHFASYFINFYLVLGRLAFVFCSQFLFNLHCHCCIHWVWITLHLESDSCCIVGILILVFNKLTASFIIGFAG